MSAAIVRKVLARHLGHANATSTATPAPRVDERPPRSAFLQDPEICKDHKARQRRVGILGRELIQKLRRDPKMTASEMIACILKIIDEADDAVAVRTARMTSAAEAERRDIEGVVPDTAQGWTHEQEVRLVQDGLARRLARVAELRTQLVETGREISALAQRLRTLTEP